MTIEKLSRLFAARESSSQGYTSADTTTQKVEESKSSVSEAVELSSTLDVANSDESDRNKKVAELKGAVQNGTYKVDSYAVAEAFAREIYT